MLLKNSAKEDFPELYKDEPATCLRAVRELPKKEEPKSTQATDFNNPLGI